MDGCELPCDCWELNPSSLEKQQVLLITEPSFQASFDFSSFYITPMYVLNIGYISKIFYVEIIGQAQLSAFFYVSETKICRLPLYVLDEAAHTFLDITVSTSHLNIGAGNT